MKAIRPTIANPRLLPALSCCWFLTQACVEGLLAATPPAAYHDIEQPPHEYSKRQPRDRFTRLIGDLESGRIDLDRSGERAFLVSLLRALEIPASSQTLVYSTTSLQLSLITPSNPRALYFNEDIYIGHVPGGRIEVISLDPELGAIFYIFDVPRAERPVRVERSERCMNCHAGDETGQVPGLILKSVVPGPTGGSLVAHRTSLTGHTIPLTNRFGGWHVTGASGFTNHWGNLIGRYVAGELTRLPNPPGERFQWSKFPVATSDILPHLIHEHQVGFVNRAVEASYRARTALHAGNGQLTPAQSSELDAQAAILARYLLFVDEAPLPAGGFAGDAAFKADFLKSRRATKVGASLKDFDLRTRLFKHRCSYMIYSSVFEGLPGEMKNRVYQKLREALDPSAPANGFEHLADAERRSIREILKTTLNDLPAGW